MKFIKMHNKVRLFFLHTLTTVKQKEKERKHQANKNKPVTIKRQQQENSCKQSVLSRNPYQS